MSDPAEFSVPVGQRQLFLDDVGIDQLTDLKRTLHQPDKKGAVIRSPDPDSTIQTRNAPFWDPEQEAYKLRVLAVEENAWQSPDGLHWTPSPGPGPESELSGVSMVVRDGRDTDSGRRYKAALLNSGFAVSPDGIDWSKLDVPPIESSDEGNFSYNEDEGLFIHTVKRGTDFGRSVAIATSTDFEHWDDFGVVFSTDAKDQEIGREVIEARRSAPLLQQTEFNDPEHYSIEIYNMGVFRYEGLYIGMPSVYHHTGKVPPEWEGFKTMNLSPYIRECVEKYGDYTGFYNVQVACSRNLKDWNRVAERRPFIETSPADSGAYDLQTIIGPSNAILRGDQLWLYYTGIRNYAFITSGGIKGYDDYRADCGAICLAVLRRDGFVSLDSRDQEGSVRTSPFQLQGNFLNVNSDAAHGELRVRVLDSEGESLAESEIIREDKICETVAWRSGEIAKHKEETVRLEFLSRNTQLFSYWFDQKGHGMFSTGLGPSSRQLLFTVFLGFLLTDCGRGPRGLAPDLEATKGPRPSTREIPDDVDYLLPLENSIVREYNLARTDPRRYAFFVSRVRPYFDGNVMKRPGYNPVVTLEGVEAVDEAVRFLRKARPLSPLTASRGLSRAALRHVEDQGPKGNVGHGGSDRSLPGQRIEMFGRSRGRVGENIAYGPHAAREVVMGLIIDDGVESRGHRKNIFNSIFRQIGVSCGYHETFQIMCVMTLAESFEDDPKLESSQGKE